MVAFLTFIFYFFLALFVLGLIGRFALRLWFRRLHKRMNQGTDEQPSEGTSGKKFTFTRKKKIIDKDQGEYVDYEELE